jgi:hypothetical protein
VRGCSLSTGKIPHRPALGIKDANLRLPLPTGEEGKDSSLALRVAAGMVFLSFKEGEGVKFGTNYRVALATTMILGGCSLNNTQSSQAPDASSVNSFFLAADITGPDKVSDQYCTSHVQIEIDLKGEASVFWNRDGEPGDHGCFHDSEKADRTDAILLDGPLFKEFKEKFEQINWSGNFEKVENAGFNPHPDCEIHHDSLPDIVISLEKGGLVVAHSVYSYELARDYVTPECKQAMIHETDIVQEIIDLMPVEPPFSSKLYYRSKFSNNP